MFCWNALSFYPSSGAVNRQQRAKSAFLCLSKNTNFFCLLDFSFPSERKNLHSKIFFSLSLARGKYSLCLPLFPLQKQPGKKSNWRQHHEDFINTIQSAKQVTKALKEGHPLPPPPPPSINPGLWSTLSYYCSCTDLW